jgi:hypothetical protein
MYTLHTTLSAVCCALMSSVHSPCTLHSLHIHYSVYATIYYYIKVGVHIADVTHFVHAGSAMDIEVSKLHLLEHSYKLEVDKLS